MQFKHPEILYTLFALLIPVLIHLFQLQRFTKTPFTNVSFLKEIELQTRKSSRLKKWLILVARLLAFTAIIIAFAQPYFFKNDTLKSWSTVIYLDNSLSMQAEGERGELLKRAIQDLVVNIPNNGDYSLLTNDQVFIDLTKESLIDQLKNIEYTSQKFDLNSILLKGQQILGNYVDSYQKFLLISDFQQGDSAEKVYSIEDNLANQKIKFDYIQLISKIESNVAIDSVYLSESKLDSRTIAVSLKNQGKRVENLILSALQNQIIVAKITVNISANDIKEVLLRIPNNVTNISLKLDYQDRFDFDNTHFISFKKNDKINVLLLTEENTYLERIYTNDEFSLSKKQLTEIGFDLIDMQNLVLVEGLNNISVALQNKFVDFVEKGGSLVLIPTKKDQIENINSIFNTLNLGLLKDKIQDSILVTKIHFSHPILQNVFEKEVRNFQYPKANIYFEGIYKDEQPILTFENQEAFITQFRKKNGSIFWIASPLDIGSSNFTNAPLIVPVFYNIGKQSVKQTQLSYRVSIENQIVVPFEIQQDAVLHISNPESDFIPRQKIQPKKVILYTDEQPHNAGFYEVMYKNNSIHNLAYNYIKDESNLLFLDMHKLTEINASIQSFNSIENALSALSEEQNSIAYFKWFVMLALLFLFIEILLLKFL